MNVGAAHEAERRLDKPRQQIVAQRGAYADGEAAAEAMRR